MNITTYTCVFKTKEVKEKKMNSSQLDHLVDCTRKNNILSVLNREIWALQEEEDCSSHFGSLGKAKSNCV